MASKETSCSRCVGGENLMIKNGKTPSGKQRFLCKKCGKTRVDSYTYNAYCQDLNEKIILLTKEGLGIRSTARVLKISTTTLLKRIVQIAKSVTQPAIIKGGTYEVDEIRTYVKRKDKLIWIVYALERATKKVVSFFVGSRINKTIKAVIRTLSNSEAKRIYTDGLRNYKYLIKRSIHRTNPFGTNYIERKNLSLRTHLKRLNRRTICYRRSALLLVCVLRIYFWG